jgi:hypothetical protein
MQPFSEPPPQAPDFAPAPRVAPEPRDRPPPAGEDLSAQMTAQKAVAAFVLGMLSVAGTMCWMGVPLGIPAIALGAAAHRELRRGPGTRGHGLATAGIVLGAVGSTLFFGWLVLLGFTIIQGRHPAPNGIAAMIEAPPIDPGSTDPGSSRAEPVLQPANFLEIHRSTGPLRTQLLHQVAIARRAGETVLVQTTATDCQPCGEVATASADAKVQSVLSHVRVLQIDVSEFAEELKGLRMNEPTAPWFYLIDARGQPSDAISADEWDDNDAENIAPVLDAFVHGKLHARRASWRGETSL